MVKFVLGFTHRDAKEHQMPYMLKLSDERGEQLRQIAEAKNLSVGDLIVDFIRAEIAAGTIAGDVPGIDVTGDGVEVTIRAPGFEVTIPAGEGPTVGDVLRGVAIPKEYPERKRRWLEGAAGLAGVKVRRTGRNSVALVSPITGREYRLPINLAPDLADQIEAAA